MPFITRAVSAHQASMIPGYVFTPDTRMAELDSIIQSQGGWRPSKQPTRQFTHGKRTTYERHHCRCTQCSAAYEVHKSDMRARWVLEADPLRKRRKSSEQQRQRRAK